MFLDVQLANVDGTEVKFLSSPIPSYYTRDNHCFTISSFSKALIVLNYNLVIEVENYLNIF